MRRRRSIFVFPFFAAVLCAVLVAAAPANRPVDPAAVGAAADTCPTVQAKSANGNGNGQDNPNGNSGNGHSGSAPSGNSGDGTPGNSGNENPNAGSGNNNAGGNGNGNAGGNGNGNAGGNGNGNAGGNGQPTGSSGATDTTDTTDSTDTSNPGNGNANAGGNGNGNGNASAPHCVNPEPGDVAGDGTLPQPVAGKNVNSAAAAGTVLVRAPGSNRAVPLDAATQLPNGTVIDTREGTVILTSAGHKNGVPQTAAFSGAQFKVRQAKGGAAPVTDIVLQGGSFGDCRKHKAAKLVAATSSRVKRSVWGSGHGNFRTRGRHGSATVRGTVWSVSDSCAGTLTKVYRGRVAVTDFGKHKTVEVPAGRSYLARAR